MSLRERLHRARLRWVYRIGKRLPFGRTLANVHRMLRLDVVGEVRDHHGDPAVGARIMFADLGLDEVLGADPDLHARVIGTVAAGGLVDAELDYFWSQRLADPHVPVHGDFEIRIEHDGHESVAVRFTPSQLPVSAGRRRADLGVIDLPFA